MAYLTNSSVSEGAKLYPATLPALGEGPAPLQHWSGSLEESRQLAWYAAYVRARHEKQIARQLEERQVSCFLPLYRELRKWKDRRKEVNMTLFPGYVFVHLDLRERLSVLQLPGIVHFVTFNGRPAVIPENEIESLRCGLTHGTHAQQHPYLKVGRRVRVRCGPMEGTEGILVRRKERFRLVLSIEAIMRSVSVEVDESDVQLC